MASTEAGKIGKSLVIEMQIRVHEVRVYVCGRGLSA